MSESEVLKTLGGESDSARSVVVPPASRLRDAPVQLVRRAAGALRATRMTLSPRERIRWPAGRVGVGQVEDLRGVLLGGVVHTFLSDRAPVQRVRREQGFTPTASLQVGAGGMLRQVGLIGGSAVMIRFGVVGGSSDPGWHYSALQELRYDAVPEPLGTGTEGGVRWTIERFLAGTHLRGLTPRAVSATSSFLRALPVPAGPIRSIENALDRLALLDVPGVDLEVHHRRLRRLIEALPAVVAHGDLWLGNLLFDGDRLSGVLDWDSWARNGVPCSDMLHLFAEHARRRRRGSYGTVVQARFWEDPEAAAAVEAHLSGIGAAESAAPVLLLAEAWWLQAVEGALSRTPLLAENRRWISENLVQPGRLFSEWAR